MLMHRYLCTYQLGSSVGSSADVGCTGTSVPISWVEVLEVLLGECCLDHWGVGTIIHPEMFASLCAIFPSDKLAVHVLLCLPINQLKCWKFFSRFSPPILLIKTTLQTY